MNEPGWALHAYRYNGLEVAGFPKPTASLGAWPSNSPALADIDGDGTLEAIWVDFNFTFYAWHLTTPTSAPQPWPMFHHDPQHTGATMAYSPDRTPPLIFDAVANDLTVSSARIIWKTNEASDSKVLYGTSPSSLISQVYDGTLVYPNHALRLTALTSDTTYYYKVASKDAAGNEAQSSVLSFRTYPVDNFVFVTSVNFGANLGGLSGADQLCKDKAVAGNLKAHRPWKAILSSETVNARDRITQLGPIYNPSSSNPMRLVANQGEFFTRDLRRTIIFSEINSSHSGDENIWTGSHGDGTVNSGRTCSSWTSISGSVNVGGTRHTSGQWLNDDIRSCGGVKRIYCISQ